MRKITRSSRKKQPFFDREIATQVYQLLIKALPVTYEFDDTNPLTEANSAHITDCLERDIACFLKCQMESLTSDTTQVASFFNTLSLLIDTYSANLLFKMQPLDDETDVTPSLKISLIRQTNQCLHLNINNAHATIAVPGMHYHTTEDKDEPPAFAAYQESEEDHDVLAASNNTLPPIPEINNILPEFKDALIACQQILLARSKAKKLKIDTDTLRIKSLPLEIQAVTEDLTTSDFSSTTLEQPPLFRKKTVEKLLQEIPKDYEALQQTIQTARNTQADYNQLIEQTSQLYIEAMADEQADIAKKLETLQKTIQQLVKKQHPQITRTHADDKIELYQLQTLQANVHAAQSQNYRDIGYWCCLASAQSPLNLMWPIMGWMICYSSCYNTPHRLSERLCCPLENWANEVAHYPHLADRDDAPECCTPVNMLCQIWEKRSELANESNQVADQITQLRARYGLSMTMA